MKKSLLLFIGLLLFDSCVDRIIYSIPNEYSGLLVVDGLITNEPGPYTVKLSKAISVNSSLPLGMPASVKRVTLFDNQGHSEMLQEKEVGIYQTRPDGMQGVIGNEYHIRIETNKGEIFESIPDKINPVGDIDSLYYQFESFQPPTSPTEHGYRIFIDAHSSSDKNDYIRWRFSGTFLANTEPKYNTCPIPPPPACSYCPLPCSGAYVGDQGCTCCRCWVTQYEDKPTVNDNQIISRGKYKAIEVGYVPVNFYTFMEKYRVQVEQMSLSENAYRYWKSVKAQKDAVNSLFQPITGQIKTNVSEVNRTTGIQGIFYAAAIRKKQLYLSPNTNKVFVLIPVDCLGREGAMGESCLLGFPGFGTSTEPPADWK